MKNNKRARMPGWLEQAFQDAKNIGPVEDDDCPICRAMRANTDPSSVEKLDLGDGNFLEVVAITNPRE